MPLYADQIYDFGPEKDLSVDEERALWEGYEAWLDIQAEQFNGEFVEA